MCQTLRLIFASVAQSCSDGLSMDLSLVSLKFSVFLFHFYHFPCSRWCEVGQHHRADEALTSSLWLWGRGLYRLQTCHSFLLLVFIFFTPCKLLWKQCSGRETNRRFKDELLDHSVLSIFKSLSVPAQLWHLSLQVSSNGKSISLQSQSNLSLEILKILEHISFGISDPTIFL